MMGGPLARRFPLAVLAWQNLTRQRARTLLAMLGITIGVVAIASLGMFGASLEQYFRSSFQDTARTVSVIPGEDIDGLSFDDEHVRALESATEYPVYAVRSSGGRVSGLGGSMDASVKSVGAPDEFVDVRRGRIPSPWRSGALVGSRVAQQTGVTAGDSVTVDGETFRVAAVLSRNSRAAAFSTDAAVLLPSRHIEVDGYSRVLVRTPDPTTAFSTADALGRQLNTDRRERYRIFDAERAIERFTGQISTINTFLLGVGAISLLVAAVSILNVMLMSTIERKEEIGVLRAVGYQRLDVLRLVLNEAVLLGVVGAVIGIVLSVLLGMGINELLLGDPMAFTDAAVGSVTQGFLFGVGASLLSGLYPAWKAANERPVEALRD
jgi:putative ABC transport system permease protein